MTRKYLELCWLLSLRRAVSASRVLADGFARLAGVRS